MSSFHIQRKKEIVIAGRGWAKPGDLILGQTLTSEFPMLAVQLEHPRSHTSTDKIRRWLNKNIQGRWAFGMMMLFENETDAILFKLKWG